MFRGWRCRWSWRRSCLLSPASTTSNKLEINEEKKKKKKEKEGAERRKKMNEERSSERERERRIRECKGTRNRDGRKKQGETSTSERRKKGGPDSFAYDGQWRQPSSEYVPLSISFHLLRIECGYAFSLSREKRERRVFLSAIESERIFSGGERARWKRKKKREKRKLDRDSKMLVCYSLVAHVLKADETRRCGFFFLFLNSYF